MNYVHPYFRIINESGMRQVLGVSFSIVVMRKTTFCLQLCGNKLNFGTAAVMKLNTILSVGPSPGINTVIDLTM